MRVFVFFLSNHEGRNATNHKKMGIETNCGWQTKIKNNDDIFKMSKFYVVSAFQELNYSGCEEAVSGYQ